MKEDTGVLSVWNMTRRCNLHCGHCYADSHDRDPACYLTEEEIAT